MLEAISIFIVGELSFFTICYVFSIVLNHEFKINLKVLISAFLCSVVYVITSLKFSITVKSIVINIIEVLLLKNIYSEKLSKSILATLVNYIIMMICETIFTLIFIYILNFPVLFFSKNFIGIIIVNFFVLCLTFIFINIGFISKLFKNIIKWYEDSQLIKFIIMIIIAFALIAFFTYQNFIGIHSFVYLIEVNIALITIFTFVIGYFNQTAKNKLILSDYDQLMEYVKTYEKVVDEKSKRQHEYKNQLILLKSMIKSNDKKTLNYINELLEIENEQENYQYLNKLKNLPSGGLKGFLLYKIDYMLQKNIIPFIDISERLLDDDVWKICDNNLQDVSRAIGVYLDNAIEAASNSKEKYILIDGEYSDDQVIFTFSNTYSGMIDFTRIDKDGYSTKGKGRGHGLALIKEVIDKNSKMSQYREINGIYYIQKLIIKR